ncbi:MAG TPA: adenylate/guanylate cyclase domain-containing protein [Burkholderiales bacterium]|nr:adenylate/guanylate cyclase domain-containing protein [Burkholderiales bacterium]
MKAERVQAAIIYAELRNFTRLSEMLDPEKVLALAGEFFTLAAKAVTSNGGKTLPVQNDMLAAAFTARDKAAFAGQALAAAQALQVEFGELGERWKTAYGFPAAVSLGLHLGETVFGMSGPQGAQQFVAFGDCVSIAERLVHRARAGEIVLSLDFMRALGATVKTLGAEELPPLDLGNKRPPVAIYGLLLESRLDFT